MRIKWLSAGAFLGIFPLFCIMFGEVGKLTFFNELPNFPNPKQNIFLWTGIQAFSAPIMGFISDIWCRKKMLTFSIAAMILSILLLKLGYVHVAIICYCLSAITVIGRATYCDVHVADFKDGFTQTREINIVNTFIAQSIPWMFIPTVLFSNSFYGKSIPYLGCVIGLFLFVIAYKWFEDRSDRDRKNLHFPLKEVLQERGKYTALAVIVVFFAINSAWNMIQYYVEGQESLSMGSDFKAIGWVFLFGVLLARFTVGWLEAKIENILGFLFGLVAAGLLFHTIFPKYYDGDIIRTIFPDFTLIGGVMLPLVYTFFCGRRINIHSIGTICGLLESVQYLTELTGSYAINHINLFKDPIIFLRVATVLIVILSTIYAFFILSKKDRVV